jgi:glycogen debranching enzyme
MGLVGFNKEPDVTAPEPFRYSVIYDHSYMDQDGVTPLKPIVLHDDADEAYAIVKKFLSVEWRKMAREPQGELEHPYLVPGAWYDNLWDWDSYFTACPLPGDALRYGKGSVLNLLVNVREDGRPPKMTKPDGTLFFGGAPIPVHAQFAYIVAAQEDDLAWLDQLWPALEAIRAWYEQECVVSGKFVWLGYQGNGLDNNPTVYGRPPKSSADITLACWHYREYRAMAKLASVLNKSGGAEYARKADELGELIRTRYWDHIDRNFYGIDCTADAGQTSLMGISWELFMKFRSWGSFYPLWAGVATQDQAAALREIIMDPTEFLAEGGMRSHSARDPIYNNTATGNPSNWQGPVWGLSTAVTAYGLARYGYVDDALELAHRLNRTFAADIQTNECLHEYYHGDTSQPVIKPGFLSWNVLALALVDDLRAGKDCTTLDLLD